MDIFIYPVSGVLKLWHLLLHNAFGLDDSFAWTLSLFGLVITIRAIIAPFSWMQYRSAQISSRIRPHKHRIKAEFAGRTDQLSVAQKDHRLRQLRRQHGYNPVAGCVPFLIQMPVFIGLYQVLMRIARPRDGLDTTNHANIGFLNSTEISAFLDGSIAGVPLPASRHMSDETLARLGTTNHDVVSFILPLLITAMVITATSSTISMLRQRARVDYDSAFARKMTTFSAAFIVIGPGLLFLVGWFMPIPAAIYLYYVANNLWTFAQNIIIYTILSKKLPLDEDFKQFTAERKKLHLQRQAKMKENKELMKKLRKRAETEPKVKEMLEAFETQQAEAKSQAIAAARAQMKAEQASRRANARERAEKRKMGPRHHKSDEDQIE